MYCVGVQQGLVDRSGQVAYVVVAGRAVEGEGEDDAGVGEVVVRDPVAEVPALVIPDRSGQGGGLLRDAEAVAGRVGEGGATAAFQAGAGENQASTGLGAIRSRTACASLPSKPPVAAQEERAR